MNNFKYKDYEGSAKISIEDNCLYGKILYITDLVVYQADTIEQLKKEFEFSVDDYIETCADIGVDPQIGLKKYKTSDYLNTPKMILEYLKAAVEDGDEKLMSIVLESIGEAIKDIKDE